MGRMVYISLKWKKRICGVAEKVLDKDNPKVLRIYKYFLVMY
jgi:hypothetical protein